MFMLYTGAKAGEALWLDWKCVDLNRAHVSFPKTKNGDPRGVPLHRDLIVELANLPIGKAWSFGVRMVSRIQSQPGIMIVQRDRGSRPVSKELVLGQ